MGAACIVLLGEGGVTQTSAVFLRLPTITIGTTSCCCHGNHKYHPLCKHGCRGHSGRLAARLWGGSGHSHTGQEETEAF